VAQTTPASPANVVTNDGFLRLEKWGSTPTTARRTTLERFSDGVSIGSTVATGLTCASGANLWCDAPAATTPSSSCALCRP
jgi:hypothetical protein